MSWAPLCISSTFEAAMFWGNGTDSGIKGAVNHETLLQGQLRPHQQLIADRAMLLCKGIMAPAAVLGISPCWLGVASVLYTKVGDHVGAHRLRHQMPCVVQCRH